MSVLDTARIVLAVSGGIAAYKAADLASKLVQAGATLDVILTAGAQEFIRPLTFQALTKRSVQTDVFAPWTESAFGHVSLAREARLLIVAPASANTLARLALGLADDLLGTVALSTAAPLVLAPAMEHGMWHHPATQAHLATLLARGAHQVGPEPGRLASGYEGDGRLADPTAILGAARFVLGRGGPLAGRRVVVTAGGTHEPLDPVRFLGNRSSGAMGLALVQAALDRGADVTAITGPIALSPPYGAEVVRVDTARAMAEATFAAIADAEVLIMAAAVADFRPEVAAGSKIKKRPGEDRLSLSLVRNPDILATANRPGLLKVGFAAETEHLIENAQAKLAAKGLAMIVANDAVGTIGHQHSAATLIVAGEPPETLPGLPKAAVAERILDRIVALLSPLAVDDA